MTSLLIPLAWHRANASHEPSADQHGPADFSRLRAISVQVRCMDESPLTASLRVISLICGSPEGFSHDPKSQGRPKAALASFKSETRFRSGTVRSILRLRL